MLKSWPSETKNLRARPVPHHAVHGMETERQCAMPFQIFGKCPDRISLVWQTILRLPVVRARGEDFLDIQAINAQDRNAQIIEGVGLAMADPKKGHAAPNFPGRMWRFLGRGPVIFGLLVLVWEFSVHALQIWSTAIPAPSRVLLEIWSNGPRFGMHSWITGMEASSGLMLAIAAAYLLPVTASVYSSGCRVLLPLIVFLARVPWIVFGPLLILWFGFGVLPAIAICFLICLQPILSGILAGFDSIPAELAEILRVGCNASPSRLLLKISLPASFPFLLRAARKSIPIALGGSVVTEFVASDTGIGYLMLSAGSKADLTQLMAALAILLAISLGMQYLMRFVERTWFAWPVYVSAEKQGAWLVGPHRYHHDSRI
jgi:NitT/TauT family transport system permease protein